MVFTGLAFLICWLVMVLVNLGVDRAILITALLFIIGGILLGERPWEHRP